MKEELIMIFSQSLINFSVIINSNNWYFFKITKYSL